MKKRHTIKEIDGQWRIVRDDGSMWDMRFTSRMAAQATLMRLTREVPGKAEFYRKLREAKRMAGYEPR